MKQIRVMTWNVLYKEKTDNIVSLIKEIGPDILCCQEITTQSHLNPGHDTVLELSKIFGHYKYVQVLSVIEDKPGNMGNAIFSKFPIVSDRSVFVQRGKSQIKEKDYGTQNRAYMEVELDCYGSKITVGTTHLSYTPGFTETPSRIEEADKLFDAIKKHKSGYIITGDFNAAPNSKIISTMESLFQPVGPYNTEKTFSTKPFSHGGFSVNGLEWRLDYVFSTPDLKVASSKVIKTSYSDHLPIVAGLTF